MFQLVVTIVVVVLKKVQQYKQLQTKNGVGRFKKPYFWNIENGEKCGLIHVTPATPV